jgi:hypothetical protein
MNFHILDFISFTINDLSYKIIIMCGRQMKLIKVYNFYYRNIESSFIHSFMELSPS